MLSGIRLRWIILGVRSSCVNLNIFLIEKLISLIVIIVKHLFNCSHWSICWMFFKQNSEGSNVVNSLVSTTQPLQLPTHGQSCLTYLIQFSIASPQSPPVRAKTQSLAHCTHAHPRLPLTFPSHAGVSLSSVSSVSSKTTSVVEKYFFLSPFFFNTKDMCRLSPGKQLWPLRVAG